MDDSFDDPMLRELEEDLAAPFKPDQVHWRIGQTSGDKTKAMVLAYLDARDVMDRFDEVVGVSSWQALYDEAGNGQTCCRIGLKLEGEWVWKSNGAGETKTEGEKGAFSDAFKRAAVLWGVGRYLYRLKSPWVAIEMRGSRPIIRADQYKDLKRVLEEAGEVANIPPSERATLRALQETIRKYVGTQEAAAVWIDEHKGMLSQLRAPTKKILWGFISSLPAETAEAA